MIVRLVGVLKERSFLIGWWLSVLLVLGAGWWAYDKLDHRIATVHFSNSWQAMRISALSDDLAKTKEDLASLRFQVRFQSLRGRVDLSDTSSQVIDDGFAVGKFEVAKHLSGVKITGRLWNGTSITREQLTMKVTIGEQEQEFVIPQVRPGFSASFSVYVPDVKVEIARYARFEYVRSTMRYQDE